jgi:hypothetical protein
MQLCRVSLVALVAIALEAAAFAQGGPPPPAYTPTGPEPPGAMTKWRWSAGLILGIPQGDLAESADASPGIRLDAGMNINPNLSAHASLRYIFVQSESDAVSLSYYDLGVGGRYALNASGKLRPYVEGELLYATASADIEGFGSSSESDPAIAGRAGGIYQWRPNMDVIFFGSYTIIFVEDGDASWLELGAGVQGYF